MRIAYQGSSQRLARDLFMRFSGSGPVLTAKEVEAMKQLSQIRPVKPEKVILITDPNRDPDDLAAFIIGSELENQGFIQLDAVVTTLGNRAVRTQRAQFAKQIFERLGLAHVPVGVGADYPYASLERQVDDQIFLTTEAHLIGNPFLSPETTVRADGGRLLLERLKQAQPKSLTLVMIAGMGDAARLLDDPQVRQLFRDKVKHVVVMGDIDGVDGDGHVKADQRSFNNTVDQGAADKLIKGVQQLGIPLTVVAKEAAYAASVDTAFYREVAQADPGKGVGPYLEGVQKSALEKLWDAVIGKVNPALTPEWFFRFFIASNSNFPQQALDDFKRDALKEGFEQAVWPRLARLNLYDPMALLAASPPVASIVYHPVVVSGPGHSQVVRVGDREVQDPKQIRHLLSLLGKKALSR